MSGAVTCASVASSVWKREVSNGRTKVNRTHVEDLKNPGEVQPPSGDHFFIVLCVEESRHRIPFTPLDNLPLDFRHDPAIQGMVSKSYTRCTSTGFHSRC